MSSPARHEGNHRKKGRKRHPIRGGSEIGDMLRTLRTDLGWTLGNAAQESGLSLRVIAKLEKGRLDTSISNLEKYLNFYGFTMSAKRIDFKPIDPTPHSETLLDEKGLPKW